MRKLMCAMSLIVLSSGVVHAQTSSAPAGDQSSPTFQRGSEEAVEETTETTPDGKTIRRTRRGKVSNRNGEMRVGEIEDGDVDRVARRQKALNHTVFGFGPFGSSNVGEKQMLYGFSYGKRWEVTTTGEISLDFLGAANGKGSLWNAGLGFNFLPSTSDISPLIGGAFGFGFASPNEGPSAGGFSGQVNAGVRMFRLSEAQMEVVASYTAVFTDKTPGVYGAQLRILF
jgi:hypothetical protein